MNLLLFFKGRVLAGRITYLFIYNSRGFPTRALLLQLLIPRFSIRLFPPCLSCVRPWARSVSGGGAERLPAPQLPVYIVLGALVSLPRADLRLQMSLGFPPRVSWLGLGRGEPARAVCAVESFHVTKCVAGGFFLLRVHIVQGNSEILFFLCGFK